MCSMLPSDSGKSAWNKIQRADEHFRMLDKEIMFTVDPKSYATVHEFDAKAKQYIWKLRDDPPELSRLSLLIGDGVHNLRAALDHMIWQLVITNGQSPTKRNEFPIFDSETGYMKGNRPKLNGISENAKCLIQGLKPYKGGDDALWLIHKIDIIDKHRYLNVLIFNYTNIGIQGPLTFQAGSQVEIGFPALTSGVLKKGTIVATMTGNNGEVRGLNNVEPYFNLKVTFNEPGITTSEVMPVVNAMVQTTVHAFNILRPHFT